MSRLSNDAAVIKELRALLVDDGLAGSGLPVSAPSAITAAPVVITYTTDDPSVTADQAITIADGDAVTEPENLEFSEELVQRIATAVTDATSVRTALEAYRTGGRFGHAGLVNMTSVTDAVAITYTTDDPSITTNEALTVADGDLFTSAEFHEYCVEANAELQKAVGDIAAANQAVAIMLAQGLEAAPVLAARSSNAIAITYTTDDPSITPDAAITIADGDTMTAAEHANMAEEINDQLDKLGDDYAAIKVAYDAIRVAAGLATS
jgi:hypothetical protein